MNKLATAAALFALASGASACNRQGGDAAARSDAANAAAEAQAAGANAAIAARQAEAAGEAEVRSLLDRIYAPYATDEARDIDMAGLMEPQLAAAMSRSQEGVNADPFIDAQDYSAFRPTYEGVSVSGDRAEATASFSNMGRPTRITYQFVFTGGGWKIADIRSAGGGSFRSHYNLPPLP